MGRINVKKLKASLSLLDIEHVMNQLGIPMYSKGNREFSIQELNTKTLMQGNPSCIFILIPKYS